MRWRQPPASSPRRLRRGADLRAGARAAGPAAPAPAPAPVLPSWTGFYAGGQLGWAQGEVDADLDGVSFDADDDSSFFGAHAG